MARPATLFEVAERLRASVPLERALPEFLDEFYTANTSRGRAAMMRDEPNPTGDARQDALLGAVAEYLTKQFTTAAVPVWASGPSRVLAEPWYTLPAESDGLREYLSFASPAEFRHHNIFSDALPLQRARRPAALRD